MSETTEIPTEFEWQGEWKPLLAWLDALAGGRMHIPFGHRPPIMKTGRNLAVTNRNDMFIVKPGEKIRIDKTNGQFFRA